jgi:hypothetical protein
LKVYQAINAVQLALSKEGIAKDRNNAAQGYKFRGIDEVYNALSPLLAKNGLCILPRCTERVCVERTNAKGTALFYVTVRAEFDFVASEDGSKHTVTTYGEAMDSGDKATNKAMSAAYKYAAMQAFSIPTEGDNDADASTHEVAAGKRVPSPVAHSGPAIIMDGLSEDWKAWLADFARDVSNTFASSGPLAAAQLIEDVKEKEQLGPEQITGMWSLLDSKCRSALKALPRAANQVTP